MTLFRVLIKRSIIFTVLFIIIGVYLSRFTYFAADFFDEFFNWGPINTVAIVSLLITIGYMPFRSFLVSITDKFFYLKSYDYYDSLQEISENILRFSNLDELGIYIVSKVSEIIRTTYVSMYLYVEQEECFVCLYSTNSEHEGKKIKDPQSYELLSSSDKDVIVPILSGSIQIGFVQLGQKLSGQLFNKKDMSIFETMNNQIASSIQNTRMYNEIKSKADKLTKLNEVQKDIIYEQGRGQIYSRIMSEVVASTDAASGYLLLRDPASNTLHVEEKYPAGVFTYNKSISIDESFEQVLKKGRFIVSKSDIDSSTDILRFFDHEKIDEFVLIPLMNQQELMGAVLIENGSTLGFVNGLDKTMLRTYAHYLGNLIKNYDLYSVAIKSSNYNKSILSAINHIVFTINNDGVVISSNQAAQELFSFEEAANIFNLMEPRGHLDKYIKQSLDEGVEHQNVEIIVNSNNEVREYTIWTKFISSVHISNESDKNLLIILSDITEIKKLRQTLLQKERLSTIANMASIIVHEIRNPLSSVGALVKLVPEQHNDEEFLELFTSLVPEELARLNELMEDLLELSRSKKLERRKVSVLDILKERRHLILAKLSEEDLFIEIKGDDIPVLGDAHKLTQVFQNIMQNGVQAMKDKGTLAISIDEILLEDNGKSKPMVRVDIVDNGSGMTEETLSNLFKPFYTTKEKGTGLGLPVTRKIIEDHNGKIEVQSKEGEGTTFSIFLPKG